MHRKAEAGEVGSICRRMKSREKQGRGKCARLHLMRATQQLPFAPFPLACLPLVFPTLGPARLYDHCRPAPWFRQLLSAALVSAPCGCGAGKGCMIQCSSGRQREGL